MSKLGQSPGDNEGQGSLACCSPCDHKESVVVQRTNNSKGHAGGTLRAMVPFKLEVSTAVIGTPRSPSDHGTLLVLPVGGQPCPLPRDTHVAEDGVCDLTQGGVLRRWVGSRLLMS